MHIRSNLTRIREKQKQITTRRIKKETRIFWKAAQRRAERRCIVRVYECDSLEAYSGAAAAPGSWLRHVRRVTANWPPFLSETGEARLSFSWPDSRTLVPVLFVLSCGLYRESRVRVPRRKDPVPRSEPWSLVHAQLRNEDASFDPAFDCHVFFLTSIVRADNRFPTISRNPSPQCLVSCFVFQLDETNDLRLDR